MEIYPKFIVENQKISKGFASLAILLNLKLLKSNYPYFITIHLLIIHSRLEGYLSLP